MEDRYRFRAFHKPTKRMFEVYGFNDDFVFEKTDNGVYVGDCNPAKRKDCFLMQCTGLKDKKGNLIYDGDIVIISDRHPFFSNEELRYIGIIKWKDVSWQYVLYCIAKDNKKELYNKCIYKINSKYSYEFEVIGNIHENKELL